MREVGEERGRPDRERGLLVVDDAGRDGRVPDVLQHGAGADPDRHQEPVEVARLVGEGRRHEDHRVGAEGEPRGADSDARGEGVAGVHHPLRLPGGARGVADLDDLVRIDPPLVEEGPGVDLVLPALLEKHGLERVVAGVAAGAPAPARAAPQHEDVLEVGEPAAKPVEHRLVLEPAEAARDEDRAGLGEREHELELARPEDGHQGVRDGADANAREVDGRELPPVGELERHHVPLADPVGGEPRPDAARDSVDVPVREGGAGARLGPVVGDEDLVRVVAEGVVQVVGGGAIRPVSGRGRGLDPLPRQHDAAVVAVSPGGRARRVHPIPSPCLVDRRARPGSVPPGDRGPARERGSWAASFHAARG